LRRGLLGLLTLWLVSILVFAATQVLPGNAAYAVLGHSANSESVHALERELGLNRSATAQYFSWLGGLLRGNAGVSLAARLPVTQLVNPRIANSAALIVLSAILATVLGVAVGVLSASRRDSVLDHGLAVYMLAITALPEFIVGVVLVIFFSTSVLHVLPAVSLVPAGQTVWSNPRELVLPVATLVLVTFPYIGRMSRGAMIDALESEYCEMAVLKGMTRTHILLRHAAPNAVAPAIQVVGLTLLYLAGGIVVVEYVFNFPGIGSALVGAVANRDIPTIQYTVIVLAAFYVCVNIVTDLLVLVVSPRRRLPRN
jgi:peptide/nickel transport system permease protein